MSETAAARPVNRLVHSTSPYLLQHAHNPVDWYPWGEEALARARDEDRPLLLSIGYSSCHWCHVMERESFENDAIAALMNENFVCIKVDREERPDLDDIYMAATLAMNHGQGGWPMTVFLTPTQEPFFAGTYFPPEDRYGRPGFGTLLERIARIWRDDRAGLTEQASKAAEFLRENAHAELTAEPSLDAWTTFEEQCASEFDSRFGGFGSAPKFPPHQGLCWCCSVRERTTRRAARVSWPRPPSTAWRRAASTTRSPEASRATPPIASGWSRTSRRCCTTTPNWCASYTEAWQITKNDAYRRVARETCDYVLARDDVARRRFLFRDRRGFGGRRGEVLRVDEGRGGRALRGFERSGGVLRVLRHHRSRKLGGPQPYSTPVSLVPRWRSGTSSRDLNSTRSSPRGGAFSTERGAKRVPPALDDKTLTAWNGLMIGALAESGRVFAEPRYVEAARRAATFLWERHRRDGRLLRSSRLGVAQGEAFLEDYAFLANALVDLYEAGRVSEPIWLDRARELAELVLDLFAARDGGFFSTSRFNETLLLRHREGHDGATPSANACAALALARLGVHFDRASFRDAAVRAIGAYGLVIERQPRAFPTSLLVLDFLRHGPTEVALVGDPADLRTEALERTLGAAFLRQRVIARGPGSTNSAPLLRGKGLVDGGPAVYICRNYACDLPITDPLELRMKLEAGER